MMNWVETLVRLQQQAIPAVLVTVASIVGSTPREPGAKMIVTVDDLFGTIGGGNLEHKACAIARAQLETDEPNQLRRFPLGAGLGQCCGGLVNLMFEPIVENSTWVEIARQFHSRGEDWVRLVTAQESSNDSDTAFLILDQYQVYDALPETMVTDDLLKAAKAVLNGDKNVGLLQGSGDGPSYFIEASRKVDFQLVIFGAGHVGRATVPVLQDLPIRIRWVDSREDQVVTDLPDNVEFICTDSPEVEVDLAPENSYFLVMTHDHALDQQLSEQILKRDDFAYFGLIGSTSKRRMFETRMSRRGFDQSHFARMTCPIGIAGISSKAPAAIAISVAGELLQVYDQSVSANNNKQKLGRAR
jgi:xanthine dehydrogenase accessory factor